MVPTPLVLSYYSNLVLKGSFRALIFTMNRIEFAVYALMQFMFVPLAGFPETFNCDSRLVASTPCLIGLSLTPSGFIERAGLDPFSMKLSLTWSLPFSLGTLLELWTGPVGLLLQGVGDYPTILCGGSRPSFLVRMKLVSSSMVVTPLLVCLLFTRFPYFGIYRLGFRFERSLPVIFITSTTLSFLTCFRTNLCFSTPPLQTAQLGQCF